MKPAFLPPNLIPYLLFFNSYFYDSWFATNQTHCRHHHIQGLFFFFFFPKEAWAINETITLTLFFTYYSSFKRPCFSSANTTPFCFNALPLFLHATTLCFCAYFSAPYGYESLELLPFAFSLFFQRNYIFPLNGVHFSISGSWCLVMLTLSSVASLEPQTCCLGIFSH